MNDQGDDDLLAELREAGRHLDPVPTEAVAAARSAFAWRTLDAELAELVDDSRDRDREAVGVRGDAPVLLTFTVGAVTIETEVVADGGRRRLLGQVVPPQAGRLDVRHPGGTVTVEVDRMGRFAADDLEPGPSSLRWQAVATGGGPVVETDWFLI